jgi:hypothetical protein
MHLKNLVSLICFLLVVVCWALSMSSSFLSFGTVIAAPILSLAGFIVSILAIRTKQQKALAWILFSVHTLLVLGYILVIIYALFFWNPRFL